MVPKPTDEKQTNFPGNQYSLILFETADKINQEIHIEHPSPLSAQISKFQTRQFSSPTVFFIFSPNIFSHKNYFFQNGSFSIKNLGSL